MFNNEDLKLHLETSPTIRSQSAIIAEWNMNIANNIFRIGNYRYRPASDISDKYKTVPGTFDVNDIGNFYTGATDADVRIDGGIDPDGNAEPWFLLEQNKKNKMLYSLEDCFKKFRPRSGINKAVYFPWKKFHHSNMSMSNRPRYYMADKNDNFKYWTSFRTDSGNLRGIANKVVNGQNYIEDTAPFIVYENPVPANRVVIKMQTNVGSVDLGPFSNKSGSFSDPLYGDLNKTTPVKWKVQSLQNNNWIDIISFNSGTTRRDGTAIIKDDGYIEISYGLIVPDKYRDSFVRAEEYTNASFLPEKSINGYAYLLKENESDIGQYHIWFENAWQVFTPEYGWLLEEETVNRLTNFVTDFVDPPKFISTSENKNMYREFEYIKGLRVVVDTMNKINSTFDLIELSPRLCADISEKVVSFNVSKTASDLGTSGLPVGQLLASNGTLEIFDYDNSFNENNELSIIKNYTSSNIQIKFYDIVVNVDGYDYFVPIKTMYSEGFPSISYSDRKVSLSLRDMYFYFESIKAPEMLVPRVSLSYAISLLLDSIGFSNYVFKRVAGEKELIIPFFFIPPDKSIAEILNDLAISTQTAMFFDEYNNFVMMSKNYMIPSINDRNIDTTIFGSNDFIDSGVIENANSQDKLANIIEIASEDKTIYNDGVINYDTRYIQRSYGSIKQASMIDNAAAAKNWIYKPVLLWEIVGGKNARSINNETSDQSAYNLSAIPLNSNLSASVPEVVGNRLANNVIDLGEAVYWLSRYNGYFYANGEIIKFDAVQYSIPGGEKIIVTQDNNGKPIYTSQTVGAIGNVWISSNQEYQDYMSKLAFNGKIYPTGLIRIYAEPKYEEVNGITVMKNGSVARHGRGQFGTKIVSHDAGLNSHWKDDLYVRGMNMESKHLFGLVSGQIYVWDQILNQWVVKTNNNQVTIKANYSTLDELKAAHPIGTIEDAYRVGYDILDNAAIQTKNLTTGQAGVNNSRAKETVRSSIIKNFLSHSYVNESENNTNKSTQTGSIQASALVMGGPSFSTTETPLNFVSYQYKPLDNKYKHFGTRMRVIGKLEISDTKEQTPIGSVPVYVLPGSQPNQQLNISGGSGGIAVMINPNTNVGYYFEIVALTEKNVSEYSSEIDNLHNVIFYKVYSDPNGKAIPIKLWGGLASITVDDGAFTGQSRMLGEKNPTVYDLAVEYQDIGSSRRFYLYINNNLVKIIDDSSPLPIYNNMALFVRGGSKCMFENVYALTNNYSQNTASELDTPIAAAFGDEHITTNESFRKYAMSGMVQSTYLSGINMSQPPSFNIYFDEFGTIMREASYLKIKYDKAYPALYAQLSPTFNRIKGYAVSGFKAGSYGAEFMVFNATDTSLNLDETSGNYLRIQGITFTQESGDQLSVDSYFEKNANFSDPAIGKDGLIISPIRSAIDYDKIKTSRMTYGKKEFSLDTLYVQSNDDANDLMGWMINKMLKPRKNIGVKIFVNPTIQLGDLVNIKYKDNEGTDIIASEEKRFVVYHMEYLKNYDGPEMTLYLSEV